MRLGEVVRRRFPGKTKALVIGGAESTGSERFEKPLFDLRSAGFQCLPSCSPPTLWVEPAAVDGLAEMGRRAGVQFVVAAGGGTTIDTAKAVAAVIGARKSCSSWMEDTAGNIPSLNPLPLVMIPTSITSGLAAGSFRCMMNIPDEQLLSLLTLPHLDSSRQETKHLLHIDTSLLTPKKGFDDSVSINCLLALAVDLALVRSKEIQDESGNFYIDDSDGNEITRRLAHVLIKLRSNIILQRGLVRPLPPVGSPLSVTPLSLPISDREELLNIALELGSLSNFRHFDSAFLSTTARCLHPTHFAHIRYADLMNILLHDATALVSDERKGLGLLGKDLAKELDGLSREVNWTTQGDVELLRWVYQDMPDIRSGKGENGSSIPKGVRVHEAISMSSPQTMLDSITSSFHVAEPQRDRGFGLRDIWPNKITSIRDKPKDKFMQVLNRLGDPFAA